MSLSLHLSSNHTDYMIFVHEKGHLYLPRPDKIFGSSYLWFKKQLFEKEGIKNGTDYMVVYDIQRTYWEALDSKEKRCDEDNKNHTTECITQFLENLIGCSLGMAEGGNQVDRYLSCCCYNKIMFKSFSYLDASHLSKSRNMKISSRSYTLLMTTRYLSWQDASQIVTRMSTNQWNNHLKTVKANKIQKDHSG